MQERGAEIVAPFRDAVGFVDGDAGELMLLVHCPERVAEGFGQGVFWRDVEEARAWVSAFQVREDGIFGSARGSAVEGCDGDARGFELGDLVFH